MKSIRSKVFETNSSSSHSLTCSKEVLTPIELIPKKYAQAGRLPITLKNYGWEYFRYYLFVNKIAYLATQLFGGKDPEYVRSYDVQESINSGSDALATLHRAVYNLTGCVIEYPQETDFSIDHESVGNGTELCLDIKKLEDFLLNEASYIETGNDNSEAPWTIGTDKGMMGYYSPYYANSNKEWPLLSFKVAEYKKSLGHKITLFGKNNVVLGPIQGQKLLENLVAGGVVEFIIKRLNDKESRYGSLDSRKGEAVKDLLNRLSFGEIDDTGVNLKVAPDIQYQEIFDNTIDRWESELHFQIRVSPELYQEYDEVLPVNLVELELNYCKE